MAPVAENEIAGSLTASESGKLRFTFADIDGIAAQGEWEASLTVLKDLAPEVRIVEPGQDGFVTAEYALRIAVESTDDYGLKTVRFHRALNGTYVEPSVETISDVQTSLRRTFAFDLSLGFPVLPIPGFPSTSPRPVSKDGSRGLRARCW